MRYVWLTFILLAAGILTFFGWQRFHRPSGPSRVAIVTGLPVRPVADTTPGASAGATESNELPMADQVIEFAMQQLGSPYTYAGTTPTGGFDCSGFLMYVYGHFGIAVPHSTALLIDAGRPVAREQARRGDMVIFTGTATTSTTPGHAGIIISEPGEPLRFIHSSSARRESGVKISQVEGTDYERRFMGIRRVLGVVPAAAATTATERTTPVPALKPTTPTVASTLAVPAPKVRATRRVTSKTKHTVTTAAAAKIKVKTKVKSAPAHKPTIVKKPVTPKK